MPFDPFADLCWLTRPPDDFPAQCRSARADPGALGSRVQALASHALTSNQLLRLAKLIDEARADGHPLTPLTPFRLGLLGNGTLDLIAPALTASAARHGIALECISGAYDQVLQEALSPESAINQSRPDAVVLLLDYRGLNLRATPAEQVLAEQSVAENVAFLATVRQALRENSGAISIVQTLAPPPEGLFGSFDRMLPGTARHLVDTLNRAIVASLADTSDILLDVATLAETVGLARWHSPPQWNFAKLPFADECVPLYADHVARIIAALLGKSRRCLVLDLDNTLWGGVIGDDGLDGISLAQGDALGEAYLSVQRTALALRERGIALAVASKNDDEVAREPFRRHPEMLLREDHIAVFQANWNDKASNIAAIANALSLGVDSMVLLDDNPVERTLVRRLLPQVAVPELPDDPALYARTLTAAGYFEAVAFSDEDRSRASYYQDNARRVALAEDAVDLHSYLLSLNMTIDFRPFDAIGRARIAQLINKSNQFNLTTRRYTETDVKTAEHDSKCFTLQVRLADRFGDNGMICVVICRPRDAATWEIDTWLMSCRVLGRGVESAVLGEVLRNAQDRSIGALIGVYRPTERNGLVREHYAKLGFQPIGAREDGATEWRMSTDTDIPDVPMAVQHHVTEPANA